MLCNRLVLNFMILVIVQVQGYDHGKSHNLTEMFEFLDNLERRSPSLTHQVLLKSGEGRPIKVFKIAQDGVNVVNNRTQRPKSGRTNNKRTPNLSSVHTQKKAIWIDCGMHGREWISHAFCIYFIQLLVAGNLKFLTSRVTFFVAPVINPDGYEYSHSVDRLWRKNRRKFQTGNRTCFGVDPNRNFPLDTLALNSQGSKSRVSNPCSQEYDGPHPFSEPESMAIQKGLKGAVNQGYQMIGYLTVHCCATVLLSPFGFRREMTPHYRDQMTVLEAAKTAIEANQEGLHYKYGPTSALFGPKRGGVLDWVYLEMKIKFAFAFEMRQRGPGGVQRFLVDESNLLATLRATLAGIEAMTGTILEIDGKGD
ncbi:hypothetical protein TCAL_15279 [Tigriopus californicus]|uniref:Peptidase M14 domain-containing protein n=1 Tax=Tigriopus californicus TaxID=6832 RepID=A0A553PMH7_TIGCA|nr:hypothetical protein TCAL_15279 [Tigriopus californicus]